MDLQIAIWSAFGANSGTLPWPLSHLTSCGGNLRELRSILIIQELRRPVEYVGLYTLLFCLVRKFGEEQSFRLQFCRKQPSKLNSWKRRYSNHSLLTNIKQHGWSLLLPDALQLVSNLSYLICQTFTRPLQRWLKPCNLRHSGSDLAYSTYATLAQ